MKRVVVLGATPLGVEMAGNLGHRGLAVDFVDEGPWALSEVLDPDVAEPVHESLTKRGVTLRFGTRVEAFLGGDGRPGARRRDVRRRARVRRRDRLPAQDAERRAGRGGRASKLGTTGGIMVDERMRTSKPGGVGRG